MPPATQQPNSNQQQAADPGAQTQAGTQQQGDPGNSQQQAQGATPPTWDEFYNGQSAEVKAAIDARFTALQNTVDATRDERDSLKKQIRTLAKGQVEGSESRQQLDKMAADLEAAELKADFMVEAVKPEVLCNNPAAAWKIAKVDNLFRKNGSPDWAAIKEAAPQLFGKPTGNANAGAGLRNENQPTRQNNTNSSINSAIRRAAGRG